MDKTPVVIFHNGESNYLKINCEITSQNNNVVVISDSENKHLYKIDNVQFIHYEDVSDRDKADHYKEFFVPYNTVESKWVWLWYLRVFVLHDYLIKSKNEKIFHIDSDNILLKNVSNFYYNFDNAYVIPPEWNKNLMEASIHFSLNDLNFYKMFIKLYEDIFINKSKFNLIEEKIKYHEKFGDGGICDMTLFYLIYKENMVNVDNLLIPRNYKGIKHVVMDNINSPQGHISLDQYETRKGQIKIYKNKKKEQNLIFDKVKKEYYSVINIHFQGTAKKLMNESLKGNFIY